MYYNRLKKYHYILNSLEVEEMGIFKHNRLNRKGTLQLTPKNQQYTEY